LLVPAEHLDSVAEQHAAALAPVIAGLQGEVSGLNSDLEQQWLAAAVAQQELEGQRSRLAEVGVHLCSSHAYGEASNALCAAAAAACIMQQCCWRCIVLQKYSSDPCRIAVDDDIDSTPNV
jgi:hypothetical protein